MKNSFFLYIAIMIAAFSVMSCEDSGTKLSDSEAKLVFDVAVDCGSRALDQAIANQTGTNGLSFSGTFSVSKQEGTITFTDYTPLKGALDVAGESKGKKVIVNSGTVISSTKDSTTKYNITKITIDSTIYENFTYTTGDSDYWIDGNNYTTSAK